MALSDHWNFLAGRPDFAQLGNRLFLVDGVHPNLVLSADGSMREMGCPAQRADLGLEQSQDTGAGEHLQLLATYVWGVQRVLTDGTIEIPSAVTLKTATLTGTNNQAAIVLEPYPGVVPTGWKVLYRLWRGTANVTAELYLLKELSEYQTQYADNKPDTTLDLSQTYPIENADTNYRPPPSRFIREWKGKLVLGGSVPYAAGTLATTAESATVTLTGGKVRASDVDGQLRITGEPGYFLITEVDEQANSWTFHRTCTNTAAQAAYVFQHEADIVRVTNPLPGNIEGCEYGAEVYAVTGSGNRITGLAEQSGMLYVLREHRVDTLELEGENYALEPLPDSPPGCVSHATISDRFSPKVYYYAGRAGVWEISGARARRVSEPVRKILEQETLHAFDEFAHAVFDPVTGLYHLWLFKTGDVVPEVQMIPSLLLTYDTQREQWYRGELSAAASGIWKDSSGAPYPVIGIPGGVARLDAECACDGEALAAVTAAGSGVSIIALADSALAGRDVRGLPVLIGDERRIILANTDTSLFVSQLPAAPPAGTPVKIGAVRWSMRTGEIAFNAGQEVRKKFHRLLLTHEPTAAATEIRLRTEGVRAESAKGVENIGDMKGTDEQFVKGAELGLRGNSCQVTASGVVAAERIKIVGLMIEDAPVK